MKRVMGCIIAVVVIVAIGVVGFLCTRDKGGVIEVLDGDGMVRESSISRFEYDRRGGDIGATYTLTLEKDKLTVEFCEGNGYKTSKKEYTVPEKELFDIERIIVGADMEHWTDLPTVEEFALDGETTSVSVTFSYGVSVSFDSDKVWPEGGWQAVNEIKDILESIADK